MSARQGTGFRLQRNHSNALPRRIISINVESTPKWQTVDGTRIHSSFLCGHAMSGVCRDGGITSIQRHSLSKAEELWQLIDNQTGPNHTTWVISYSVLEHAILCGLTHKFERAELMIDWPRSKRTRETNVEDEPHCQGLCVLENPPTILACRNIASSGRLVFVDLGNWFSLPLDDLAKGCRIERIQKPSNADNIRQWERRCAADCEIVFMTFAELLNWTRREDMGMFRYTAAAQAMAAFRHRYMEHDILIHDNMDVKTLERQSYYGGRTEVFKLGTISENCHHLDVNSLFPGVMRVCNVPFMLDQYELCKDWSSDFAGIDWANSIAQVELHTQSAVYPYRTEGLTLYPTGTFRTVLAGQELEHAANNGHILAFKGIARYRTAVLFRPFVDGLYDMRQAYKRSGNVLYDLFTKRVMNSLYGKFGQKSPRWVNVPKTMAGLPWTRWHEKDSETGQRVEYRSVGWQIQRQTNGEEIEGSFIAISAFITAAARRYMDWLRWIAGLDNIYYQGVDSLIVNSEGYKRLKDSGYVSDDEIGKLRLQLSFNTGQIYGCNDYRIGTKTVVSGRSTDYEIDESGAILQRKYSAVPYLFNGRCVDTVSEFIEPWERQSTYRKGRVDDTGRVHPFCLTATTIDKKGLGSHANNL